jgi:dihydrofolate synthase/folylpolyglutamate synthase
VTSATLQGALEALYGLERRKDKLGLDGTRALLAALGNPERRFRSVHVAGTNGKGTTCALIERALRAAGVRTGLFTSPHLVDFRERIRVDGRWADEAWLFETLRRIESLPAGSDRTFFEVATALGFAWFAHEEVQWAVAEVGLGGRLDTTNVLQPELCVITSIGLDHMEILGDTMEAIAREKAGIIKPGVPVVVADSASEAGEVLARIAAERGSKLVVASEAVRLAPAPWAGGFVAETESWGSIELEHLLGGDPRENIACALAALDQLARSGVPISAEAVQRGFRQTRWPGRFERCPGEPRLWWDGAHNPHGAERLARSWRSAALPDVSALVLALSRDKDAAGMLAALRPIVAPPRLYATRSRNERAFDPALIVAAAGSAWQASSVADVPSACRAALEATTPSGTVLLAGSLFAVGEAMEAFGGAPGAEQ